MGYDMIIRGKLYLDLGVDERGQADDSSFIKILGKNKWPFQNRDEDRIWIKLDFCTL